MQRESEKGLTSHLCNLITRGVHKKNSSDSERAPGARSKSDELSLFMDTSSYRVRADFVLETAENMLHLLGSGVNGLRKA